MVLKFVQIQEKAVLDVRKIRKNRPGFFFKVRLGAKNDLKIGLERISIFKEF
jgi:hypothetical protein